MKPKYIHTAVCKGNGVCVTGHALLLTVIGAGGRSHNMASVDVVRVDCLPTWCMPGKIRGKKERRKKQKTGHGDKRVTNRSRPRYERHPQVFWMISKVVNIPS